LHYIRKRRRLLPLLPLREERAGERRVILRVAGLCVSSWMPLSPLLLHGERELALSPILRAPE